MKKYKKRHLLLLEVMIAIALIVICVIPLISPHLFVLKYQREFVDKVELDHLVNLLYADFSEKMYKNEISWDQIAGKQEHEIDEHLLRRVGYTKKLPFKGTYRFGEVKHKPKPPQDFSVYLVTLDFTFSPEELKYHYEICVVRDLTEEKQYESPTST